MDPTSTPDNPIPNSKSMEGRGIIQFRRKPKFRYVSLPGTYLVRTMQVNVPESYWFGYRSSTDLESR